MKIKKIVSIMLGTFVISSVIYWALTETSKQEAKGAESFGQEVKEGKLTFESINIDHPDKKQYIQNYQLQSTSFFLSLKKDGKEIEYENVDRIWQLAREEGPFKEYVKSEIKKYLEM